MWQIYLKVQMVQQMKCDDFGQQRYAETRRGSSIAPEKYDAFEFYVTGRLHEQFFVRQNLYLANKS